MMRATACALVVLAAAGAALGMAIVAFPALSAVQAVVLVAPIAGLVVVLFYAKPDGGNVVFYWSQMFAGPGAPRWRRALYGMALHLGVARRYGGRQ